LFLPPLFHEEDPEFTEIIKKGDGFSIPQGIRNVNMKKVNEKV